jgi:hypothetical protein
MSEKMSEVKTKIEEWIKKCGFPLEMKVAKSFIKAGFDVGQSVYYMDSESEKFRETDIIATKSNLINGVWVNIALVIECKSTIDKPWVILINDGLKYYHDDLPAYITNNGLKFLKATRENEEFKSDFLFRNSRKIGYSLITAFNKDGKEPSYEAIQSLTKACEYFVKECSNKREYQINIYLPIIIVEGMLFNATLTETEELKIEQVNNSEFQITRSFHSFGNANFIIFDHTDLDKTAINLMKQCNEFYEKYSKLLIDKINLK